LDYNLVILHLETLTCISLTKYLYEGEEEVKEGVLALRANPRAFFLLVEVSYFTLSTGRIELPM